MQKSSFRLIRSILVLVLLVSMANCGLFQKEARIKYPNQVSSQMKEEFNRAESDFKAKRYSAARTAFQTYSQRWPYNRLSDQASYRLGQIAMLDRNYGEASAIFSALIQKTPDPAVASRAFVKAGICQFRLKNDGRALNFFSKVQGQYIRRHDKAKAGGLALILLKKQQAGLEAKAYYYAMLADGFQGLSDATIRKRYGKESPARSVAMKKLQAWSKTPATPGAIDSRFLTYNKGAVSAPYVNYKLGMSFYDAGNNQQARKYLGELVTHYSYSPLATKASPILAKLGYRKKDKKAGKQFKVGVILPLSGKYEKFGSSTLSGMECAVGAKVGCHGVTNIRLITRDDGGNPANAIRAVEDLVQNEKVVAIVGPLSSASAMAAAKKAQELGVPMISLAQKEGIPKVGNNIYRFSLTPNQQVKALLMYSTKKLGKKAIGVFHPNTNYGKVFMEKFKSMAPGYGAEMAAHAGYANSKNVTDELRNLKFSVSKVSPKLPLGFNAIFIPDSYIAVLNILPQLKISGLENMILLGTNAWNDPNLAGRSGGRLEGSVFLDIYFKDSKSPRVKNFVRQYQAAYGHTPTTLEAMGYDAIGFLSKAFGKRKKIKAAEARQLIGAVGGYQGVTGLRAFGSNREARVKPFILTVKKNKISEVGK